MAGYLFAWVSLADAAICLLFGTMVFLRDIRSRLNRIFMLLCLSAAYWAFAEFELRHSVTIEQAIFWSRFNFLWPVSVALLLHFVFVFTKQRRLLQNRLTFLILYGLAAVVSALYLNSRQMLQTPIEQYWGWTFAVPETSVYRLSLLVVVGMAISALFFTARFYRQQTDPTKKAETRLVLIGISLPIILGSGADAILPQLGIRIPETSVTTFTIGVAGFVSYAIWKYELFGLTPAAAADKIITAISDCLFLIDPTGNILTANRAATDLLGYSKKELVGKPVNRLFHKYSYENGHQSRKGTSAESLGICDIETNFLTKDGCLVPISLSDSFMRDKNGRKLGSVLIARDITERKLAEKNLRESESRLQVIMESVQAGIIVIDPDTHTIVDVNTLSANMIGASKEEIAGSVCHKYICPAERGACPITDLHQTVDQSERVLLTVAGNKLPILKSVTKVMLGGKEHLLESFIDISDRKQIEEKLKVSLAEQEKLVKSLNELATHDGLTGLYNHREFYTLLDDELVRAQRYKRPVSLLMLDIDHFKRVNDKYGHLAGDAVLKELSTLLVNQLRAVDRVCRYGGEEITVILPEDDAEIAADTAERLRAAVERHPFSINSGLHLRLTVSIGVASVPADAESAQLLVAAADAAMFASKQGGRNQISRYEPKPGRQASEA